MVKHAGKGISVTGRETTREEGGIFDEIGVHQGQGASRRTLGSEVVDLGNPNSVQIVGVLPRAPASNQEVVPVVHSTQDAREGRGGNGRYLQNLPESVGSPLQ